MTFGRKLVDFSLERPKLVTIGMSLLTLAFALLAALPSIWPQTFSMLHPLKIDTDPENMLPHDEGVRVFHDKMKKELALYDILVVGVVNEGNPNGVFNPQSLKNIYELTEYAKTLHWEDKDGRNAGVIEVDIIAPSTVDNVEQAGLGTVSFEWLMQTPPESDTEALAVRDKASRLPFLNGTLVSEDGKAIALYLPLTSKDISHQIALKLEEKISQFSGSDEFHITGLPVAEDTFGVEMFKQMMISAPMAMVIIFLLMLFFFHKLALIIPPLIVAIVSVVCTMGLLVVSGFTVHIMSSMIPIFIMPIAVLDAIHVISEFFDRYQETKDRKKTMRSVMQTLFTPMLYTSLTTCAGFASLALTPIPPVQVFGAFIAIGVLFAFFWTITFIPAAVAMIPERKLEDFGLHAEHGDTPKGFFGALGMTTFRRARVLIAVTVLLAGIAAYGISLIRINDNPTKWFEPDHPIRVADRVLNEHFGGTYMAYLALEALDDDSTLEEQTLSLQALAERKISEFDAESLEAVVFSDLVRAIPEHAKDAKNTSDIIKKLDDYANEQAINASGDEAFAWDEVIQFLDGERQKFEVFKRPEVLEYVARLQQHLQTTSVVGKSNSLADIVKTIHRELLLGKAEEFRIPDSINAVGQTLVTYQNSHRPNDLWHFATPDFRKTSIWVQLKSGDNQDMVKVVDSVENFFQKNPPPAELSAAWFGLTYINVVWQDKMVTGMLEALLGSFLVVLLMMIFLFRSALWGILCMVPLTVTIGLIYGAIGLVGKDYDMPVAVLSSLSLGLSVDYAIHFLARSRELRERKGSWKKAIVPVFGEPVRAISRNVVVVGVGFLPLLAATLVPYQTVGIFIAAILVVAGIASILILPALITVFEKQLFPESEPLKFRCRCGTCIITGVLAIALVALNAYQFFSVGWTSLSLFSAGAVVLLLVLCCAASRSDSCKPLAK